MSLIKKYFNSDQLAIAIMIFLITIIAITLLWSIDKGFDLADEGLHFAFSKPETINNNGLFNYDLFFKLQHEIINFEFDVVALRGLKFLSLILVFILGNSFFRKSKFSKLDTFFLAIAVFCSYTYLTQSLSYNTISFLLVVCYFYSYTAISRASFHKQNVLFLSMAILSSLCYFVKPPLSLALLGITVILSVISFSKIVWRHLLFRLLIILIGYFIVQLLFQVIFSNYTFIKVLNDSMELSTYYGAYSKSILIKRIVVSFKWVFILSIAGWFLASLLNSDIFNLRRIIYLLLIGILLSYFFISHFSSNEFDVFQYGLMITASIGLGFFTYYLKGSNYTWQNLIIIILLFIAPFLCAFGSNVYFFRTSQQYLFFWFLLLVYIKSIGTPMSKSLLISWYLVFSIFISIKIYSNVIRNPDNQPKLSNDFVDFAYGRNKHIKLDKNQAQYLTNLKEKLNKWSPNRKEIIGLYAMPGDIVLIGFTNYYNPLIWDNFQWNFLRGRLKNNSEFKYKPMPIIIAKDLDNSQRKLLEGYKQVDSVKYYRRGYIYILKPL